MYRILALLLMIFAAYWWYDSSQPEFARPEEAGPFPSDWFMQQRMWPHATLDHEKVLRGAREAAAMRNRSLDEDPFWVQRGPTNIGGRITDIVGHPTDDNIYYVASASGGVFKTTDGGQNYAPISDAIPMPSCGALALDPSNPNRIYLGTGEANWQATAMQARESIFLTTLALHGNLADLRIAALLRASSCIPKTRSTFGSPQWANSTLQLKIVAFILVTTPVRHGNACFL